MRRPAFSLALLISLATACPVRGGVCVPADAVLSTVTILPPAAGCQYVFNPDGSLSGITATVELLDAGGAPIPGALILTSFAGVAGTMKKCPNLPDASAMTDAAGIATVTVGKACGCGTFTLSLVSVCPGDLTTLVVLGVFGPFDGTSPDLNGSCDVFGSNPVNVIDLGIWAGCLTVYDMCCDFDCNGAVNVLDLGIWASGLTASCF